MAPIHSEDDNRHVFTVRDMPHYAAYLQFLINIIQIHFEHVKLGAADHRISEAINPADLEVLCTYLLSLQPGDSVDIKEKDARVLYASFVIVSRLLLTDYGEEIASRLMVEQGLTQDAADFAADQILLVAERIQSNEE